MLFVDNQKILALNYCFFYNILPGNQKIEKHILLNFAIIYIESSILIMMIQICMIGLSNSWYNHPCIIFHSRNHKFYLIFITFTMVIFHTKELLMIIIYILLNRYNNYKIYPIKIM